MLAVRSNGEGSSRLRSVLLATFLLDSFYDTCIDHGGCFIAGSYGNDIWDL